MNPKLNKLKDVEGFEEIYEDIWVIHNFITIEERNFYLGLVENSPEEDWWKREPGWWHGKFLPVPAGSEVPENIVNRLRDILGDKDDWSWGSPRSVHRIKPGEKMFLHSDNPNEKSGLNNWVDLSFVLYHNNFNGGEIIYPELGIEYHPVEGDLLMHPGLQRYLHGTKEVLPGPNRYNSTMWAYDIRAKELHEKGLVFEQNDLKNQLTSLYKEEQPKDLVLTEENKKNKRF